MRPETLKQYAQPVPRYTSYPTAPHFSEAVGAAVYEDWLRRLTPGSHLSYYLHVPFCDQLCWYCGCNTKATQQYAPVARYVQHLAREIEHVGSLIGADHIADHIHFGGGSPSILSAEDILLIGARLRRLTRFAEDIEFAVEVDPRQISDDQIRAFASIGVNRLSVGVQDFEMKVQKAINRLQPFETTKAVIDGFRAHGVQSVNVDLVYGLPFQTRDSVEATIDKVIELRPDRVALFGYAHLPQRLTHQRLIPQDDLPGVVERFAQANRAANRLMQAGYLRVGLDHFALPGDRLGCGDIRRNFQGYTTDAAETLIGLGASSIGRLPQGYVQNATATAEYERRIAAGNLATARGHAMSVDDEMRSLVIERLMCQFQFPERDLRVRFGTRADEVVETANMLVEADGDGLVEADPDGNGFRVTDKGRLFVRSIASVFDAYLESGEARHSAGI